MCISPIKIGKGPDSMLVGCGKCQPCHIKYCNQWRLRLQVHAAQNPVFYCLTLTYNNKYLPLVTENKRTWMTLRKTHIQDFMKALRYKHCIRYGKRAPPLSYLACGEYGDKFKRPHYHMILFNAHVDDILLSWNKGNIHFGNNDLNATTNYTLKYQMKGRMYKLRHKGRPYAPPFMVCSKGIGKDLIYHSHKRYRLGKITYQPEWNADSKPIICVENVSWTTTCYKHVPPELVALDNITVSLPRYYTKKLNMYINLEDESKQMLSRQIRLRESLMKEKRSIKQWNKQHVDRMYGEKNDHEFDNLIIDLNDDNN